MSTSTEARRGALLLCAALVAAACGGRAPTAGDARATPPTPTPTAAATPEPVPLPGLERFEPAVKTQIEKAHADLQATIAAQPGDTKLMESYGRTGMYFHAYKLLEPAAACYRNARRLAPDDVRWVYYLADVVRAQGHADQAVALYRRVLELRSDYEPALIWLGRVQLDQDAAEQARASFARALETDPDSAAALVGLGRVATREKKFAEAVKDLEQALRLASDADSIHFLLGMAYRGLGDTEAAERHLKQRGNVQVWFPDPLIDEVERLAIGARTYTDMGERLGRLGRYEESAKVLRKAIETNPKDAVAYLYLGIALTRTGDPDAGLDAFGHVLSIDPRNEQAHLYMARILVVRGDDRQAASHLRAAIASNPGSIPAQLGLGQVLQRLGDQPGALAHYQRAIALDPGNAQARLGRAFALIWLGRHKEARRALEGDIETFPDEVAFPHALARLLAASPDASVRDGARAIEIAQRLAKRVQSLGLGETIGMALAEAGQSSQAVAWQLRLIQAAQSQHVPAPVMERLQRNLERYQAGEACREPWAKDDPVFSPPRPEGTR